MPFKIACPSTESGPNGVYFFKVSLKHSKKVGGNFLWPMSCQELFQRYVLRRKEFSEVDTKERPEKSGDTREHARGLVSTSSSHEGIYP